MKKTPLYLIAAVLMVGLVVTFWVARGILDFDLTEHTVRDLSFNFDETFLSGTLVTPKNINNPPIALIVHGDGAQDRFSNSGYLPLINVLVDAGIGVFSWDKAGVGESTGNWLNQSMDDRANEALAALKAVSAIDSVKSDRIGFIGFSQAGWVLPRIANRVTPAFTVIVGGAVSWRDQGAYYSRIKMISKGLTKEIIEQRLLDRRHKYDMIFKQPANPLSAPDMEAERFRFVAGEYWENSTKLIASMDGPVFAMWGQDDLNVNAQSDSKTYLEQWMPLITSKRVVVVPNATHGLLRSSIYNYQLSSDWPWYLNYIYLGMGRKAYAEDTLDKIIDWILATTKS